MDIIFLDTSIFEANNFLEGKRINEILKLSEEGNIKIVLPKLTFDEIINRIKKNIEIASSKFSKCRNETRVLRNIPSLKDKLETFDIEKAQKDLIDIVEKKFSNAKIVIIDYQLMDIKEIFDGYFSQSYPFSQGKKDEFPDAFALKIIENWSKDKNLKIKVFAKDNDINNYTSDYLIIGDKFETYLDLKLQEIAKEKELYQKINNAINKYRKNIIDEIINWVSFEIDDYTKYYKYSNYLEVHDIEIKKINVELGKHQITSVDDEYIALQFKVKINFKVELTIDDEDYMYKDDDTKDWVFLETTNLIVNEERYVDIDTLFYLEENEIIDYEIEEINNGQKMKI